VTSRQAPLDIGYGVVVKFAFDKETFLTKSSGGISVDSTQTPAPGQPQLLRAMNERQVLEFTRLAGPVSRANIARASGLSKPTVSLALASLEAVGLVQEAGRSSGSKGPRAQLYELNPASGWVVGIDVGRLWVRAAAANICGQIVARLDERSNARSSKALIAQIGGLAHKVAAEAGIEWGQVTHATVGSPGVLDPSHGLLEHAPNLPGWGRQGLVGAIREQLGTGVSFENDVNLAALAERVHGRGRGVSDFVYLWVGTGVGLGIVIGGNVYRGAGGAAGEIAYLPIGEMDEGAEPDLRRGWFEKRVGASAVVRRARGLGMRPPLSPRTVFAAARRGDELALRVVAEEAHHIALAIATVVPVLAPRLVILGGGIAGNGDLLLEPIDRELRALSPFRPELAVSELGDEAVLSGAVATALEAAQDTLYTRVTAR
jgi:predicted NBD/HSP70 family sugar kinase